MHGLGPQSSRSYSETAHLVGGIDELDALVGDWEDNRWDLLHLVCRLLREQKKMHTMNSTIPWLLSTYPNFANQSNLKVNAKLNSQQNSKLFSLLVFRQNMSCSRIAMTERMLVINKAIHHLVSNKAKGNYVISKSSPKNRLHDWIKFLFNVFSIIESLICHL